MPPTPCAPHCAGCWKGLHVAMRSPVLPNTVSTPCPSCHAPAGAVSSAQGNARQGDGAASLSIALVLAGAPGYNSLSLSHVPGVAPWLSVQHRPSSLPAWPSPHAWRSGSRRKVSVCGGTSSVLGLDARYLPGGSVPGGGRTAASLPHASGGHPLASLRTLLLLCPTLPAPGTFVA